MSRSCQVTTIRFPPCWPPPEHRSEMGPRDKASASAKHLRSSSFETGCRKTVEENLDALAAPFL